LTNILDTIKRPDFIRDIAIAIVFLIIGSFMSPIVSDWFNENFGKTPQRLVGLLQDNKIQEFNTLKKEIIRTIH
jgi:hypothetical protein